MMSQPSGSPSPQVVDPGDGPARGRSPFVPVAVFVAWTAFVWITRIRNALGDAELSSAGRAQAYVLSAVSLVGAVVVGVIAVRDRRGAAGVRGARAVSPLLRGAVLALAAWTVVVWVVRSVAIAVDGRGIGFVAVHVALGLISIAVAVWAGRAVTSA